MAAGVIQTAVVTGGAPEDPAAAADCAGGAPRLRGILTPPAHHPNKGRHPR